METDTKKEGDEKKEDGEESGKRKRKRNRSDDDDSEGDCSDSEEEPPAPGAPTPEKEKEKEETNGNGVKETNGVDAKKKKTLKKVKMKRRKKKRKTKMTPKKELMMKKKKKLRKKKMSKWTMVNPNLGLCTRQLRFSCVIWLQPLPNRKFRPCAKDIQDFSVPLSLIHNLNEDGSDEVGLLLNGMSKSRRFATA